MGHPWKWPHATLGLAYASGRVWEAVGGEPNLAWVGCGLAGPERRPVLRWAPLELDFSGVQGVVLGSGRPLLGSTIG